MAVHINKLKKQLKRKTTLTLSMRRLWSKHVATKPQHAQKNQALVNLKA
jgi:hypothetical protein